MRPPLSLHGRSFSSDSPGLPSFWPLSLEEREENIKSIRTLLFHMKCLLIYLCCCSGYWERALWVFVASLYNHCCFEELYWCWLHSCMWAFVFSRVSWRCSLPRPLTLCTCLAVRWYHTAPFWLGVGVTHQQVSGRRVSHRPRRRHLQQSCTELRPPVSQPWAEREFEFQPLGFQASCIYTSPPRYRTGFSFPRQSFELLHFRLWHCPRVCDRLWGLNWVLDAGWTLWGLALAHPRSIAYGPSCLHRPGADMKRKPGGLAPNQQNSCQTQNILLPYFNQEKKTVCYD